MKKLIVLIFSVISLGVIHPSANAALGLPENTARLGYSFGVARLNVDDPQGDTQANYSLQPFKLIYTDWWKNGNRFWLELFYQEANLNADDKRIGQYVKSSGVNLMLQKNFIFNTVIRPWFGVGAGISVADYEKRHILDDEGYLLNTFPDRRTQSVGVLLSVVNEWQYSKASTIGTGFLQRIPLDGAMNNGMNRTITESLLSVYFLVRY